MEEIYSGIYTKRDLGLFYKEIDQLIDSIFKIDMDFSKASSEYLGETKKQAVEKYFTEKKVDPKNPVAVKEALTKIRSAGETFPVISLTLAFEPTEKILKDISLWFIKRVKTKVILDIDYERSFIGGAFISFEGKYKDYSLNEKIDNYFEKDKRLAINK